MFGRTPFPTDRRPAVPADARAARLLLVRARSRGASGATSDRAAAAARRGAGAVDARVRRARARAARQGLLDYAVGRRWFGGKSRPRKGGRIADVVPLDGAKGQSQLVLFEVDYVEGEPEPYVVPLSFVAGGEAARIERDTPRRSGAPRRARQGRRERGPARRRHRLRHAGAPDGVDPEAHHASSARRASWRRSRCARSRRSRARSRWCRARASSSRPTRRCSSATRCCSRSIARSSPGPIPSSSSAASSPSAAPRTCRACSAAVEYRGPNDKEPATLATVQELVPNEGDAWASALASLDRYFERVCSERATLPSRAADAARHALAAGGAGAAGADARAARRLHRARAPARPAHGRDAPPLASELADVAFAPQPFTSFYQRSLYQGAHRMWFRTVETLRRKLAVFPEALRRRSAPSATTRRTSTRACATSPRASSSSSASACHGDCTSARCSTPATTSSSSTSRASRDGRCTSGATSAVRSSTSPACCARSTTRPSRRCARAGCAPRTRRRCCRGRARGRRGCARRTSCEYLKTVGARALRARRRREKERLLAFYQLEKCIYEIRYELNNRPDWVEIPLQGLRQAMAEEEATQP